MYTYTQQWAGIVAVNQILCPKCTDNWASELLAPLTGNAQNMLKQINTMITEKLMLNMWKILGLYLCFNRANQNVTIFE